ncbi:BREX system serine/threonine kinase PglW [Lipingzhangella sp. LS1_29]|uniref:BREX system serine/threonine kinase PglW n=1 Tax=Lipingzhangella rawalii TaxID=2055835 RepID=A0ABU2H622_9ACTN|nr:BREX system serine/threonine kinase PglW [Lipingzhangella rawalii]MDS1270764.1 BREX system serine/threonine kinase PglW [Lipingzhangella rawalii]
MPEEERWHEITPSEYEHERRALEYLRSRMPDEEPYRAWSNFTFTADTGHIYEVDLLIATRVGLYLVEIKSLTGRLTSSGADWVQTRKSGTIRRFADPVHLTDLKAKRLKSLLDRAASKHGLGERVPRVHAAVFLSDPNLAVDLAEHHRHHVYGTDRTNRRNTLPDVWQGLLGGTPHKQSQEVSPRVSRALPKLLERVGIQRSATHRQVGPWQLETPPIDEGPTWQDYLATHVNAPAEKRRVRLYLIERGRDEETRTSIHRAAQREMQTLHGIDHSGIVRADSLEEHDAGPALVFRHQPEAMRLDHYLATYGDQLDVHARLDMVRQLAEALAHAHRHRLYHRALSASSVLVTPQQGPGRDTEATWLRPRLQVKDWQIATREIETDGGASTRQMLERLGSATRHVERHVDPSTQVYLAPEISAANPDPVALDVFGLGTLTYLVFGGQAPAEQRSELLARLEQDNGLRPSAVADGVSAWIDELTQAATAPVPAQRLDNAADFLDMLVEAELEATAPAPEPDQPESDPLYAAAQDLVAGQWRITKRLGTGSTCRAFLATNEETGELEVLKVALSDDKAARLEHEARVLQRLDRDSSVTRLVRPEPLVIGGRTVLVLDYAGDSTVARKLREHGRLSVDELESYSRYLFQAVDFLEGEGVTHRDLKPDNIAIRTRRNRTRQLVLFDFSLAGIPATELEAGTRGYLDPFLGKAGRETYDDHAERYALAVTLHEMASGELPVWGDGRTDPRFTDGPPTLAAEAFDPAVREGLVDFFRRALHRDAKRRFSSLKEMEASWRRVFEIADATPPVSSDPGEEAGLPAEEDTPKQARDAAARAATRDTALDASGLSTRAVSAATRLDAATVGDLLTLPSKSLFTLPGLGAKTRKELQSRIREWRERLGTPDPTPQQSQSLPEVGGDEHRRAGLETVAAALVPKRRGKKNAAAVEATRLLLGLPDDEGTIPPPWPVQARVAEALDPPASSAQINQILKRQRSRWRAEPLVRSVLDDLVELLTEAGRVMSADELAAALITRRGAEATGPQRQALAMAAVRAATEADPEIDQTEAEQAASDGTAPQPTGQRLAIRRRRRDDRIMVALEAPEGDARDVPSGPALLDYADRLGEAADRLAAAEMLPTPAAVLRELRAVSPPPGEGALDDRRLVFLAAAAAENAAASPRLEIYPRDLDPVRALRLTQAGLVPAGADQEGHPYGLTPQQVEERVTARFPLVSQLPEHPKLAEMLRAAGFDDLEWQNGRYVPRSRDTGSSVAAVHRFSTASAVPSRWNEDDPEQAEALRANERLRAARGDDTHSGGFRALTVRLDHYARGLDELVSALGVVPVHVGAEFLQALRSQVVPGRKPTWETVVRADAPGRDERSAAKLAEFTARAWELAAARLRLAREQATGPLLLHDAAVLTRYDDGGVLAALAEEARRGGAPLWVLCPMTDPQEQPRLDGTLVPARLPHEWIPIPDAWASNRYRGAA